MCTHAHKYLASEAADENVATDNDFKETDRALNINGDGERGAQRRNRTIELVGAGVVAAAATTRPINVMT